MNCPVGKAAADRRGTDRWQEREGTVAGALEAGVPAGAAPIWVSSAPETEGTLGLVPREKQV